MNLFVALRKDDGSVELVTPPLDDVILPGVTRDSVLCLARDHASGSNPISGIPNLTVSERYINMGEVVEAAKKDRLLEVFGTGVCIGPPPATLAHFLLRYCRHHLPCREDQIRRERNQGANWRKRPGHR